MNVKYALTSLIIFAFSAFSAGAQTFTEGEHYDVVEGFDSSDNQIIEFFSFYCPACYAQEAFMKDLKATLPADTGFVRNPIQGMPGRDATIETLLAKAAIAANLLKVEDPIIDAIFRQIHQDRKNFSSVDELRTLFLAQGISAPAFDRAMNSFATKVQLKKMQQNTAKMRKQGHTAVPTLLINGQYKPNIRSLKSLDDYRQLITFLLNKPAA